MTEFISIVYISYYISYFINFIGIIENLLTFIIFSRKAFEKSPIRFYGKSLALFDSFVLFNLACGIVFISSGRYYIHTSEAVCKIFFFISMGISPIPGWILVTFSIDQTIKISMTKRFKFFHKSWFKYSLILAVVLIHCGIYSDVFMVTNINNIKIDDFTNETLSWCDIRTDVLPFVYISVSVSIPLIFIIMTTFYIVRVLIKSKNRVSISEISSPKRLVNSSRRKHDLMYGFNSVILNILFIFFSLPIVVFYVMPISNLYISIILKSFGFVFFYSHFITHFWIYFIVNKIFRQEVLCLFHIRQQDVGFFVT